MIDRILYFITLFGFLMVAMTVHEFAHAYVAYKLGDTTAKYSGRLTLNPLAHIDPVWTFIFPLFLFITSGFIFGMAKPVPINYSALKNPKRDVIWVGISGPAANFILALLLSMPLRLMPAQSVAGFIFENLILINVVLGVFNLVPIPPLDGSRILLGILPRNIALKYSFIETYGFIILILFIVLGVFENIVRPVVKIILGWLIP